MAAVHSFIICYLVLISALTVSAKVRQEGTKCQKEPMFGDHSFNLYYCTDPHKPRCCLVEKKFSCCIPGALKELHRQLQIWGSIGGIMALTIFIYIWYKYDFNFCENHKTLREQYEAACCCLCRICKRRKYGPEDTDELSLDGSASFYGDSAFLRGQSLGGSDVIRLPGGSDVRTPSGGSDVSQVKLQELDIPSKMQPSYSGNAWA